MIKYTITCIKGTKNLVTHIGYNTNGSVIHNYTLPKEEFINLVIKNNAENDIKTKMGIKVNIINGKTKKYLRTGPDDSTENDLLDLLFCPN